MNKTAVFLLAAALIFSGCRNRELENLPEVKPLPGEENSRITLNVDIADNSDKLKKITEHTPSDNEKKRTVRKKRRKNPQVILSPRSQKQLEKKRSAEKRRELVPSGVGLIDSELNSVEQSYLQEVRSRREQQVRTGEQLVFGSFSPGNIFKRPQD